MSSLDNPLWDYATAVYARPEIAAACLRLQDQQGLDADILLAAAWAASLGYRIGVEDAAALEAIAGPLHAEAVHPVRELRRRAAADAARFPGLKEKLLAAELQAERIEIAALHEYLREKMLAAPSPGTADLEANLLAYAGHASPPLRQLIAALRGS
ncbi:MAG: TIGR02444 family protein [Bryobacteraceae bacterium]|nr:TIGR02444 family protein [Bryobacteraceae bacterium]